ncbi:hypothetical protein Q8A73_004286 [Channa argus]|nr:hypothetical protein Q8A73_004286 [Channa argus]
MTCKFRSDRPAALKGGIMVLGWVRATRAAVSQLEGPLLSLLVSGEFAWKFLITGQEVVSSVSTGIVSWGSWTSLSTSDSYSPLYPSHYQTNKRSLPIGW